LCILKWDEKILRVFEERVGSWECCTRLRREGRKWDCCTSKVEGEGGEVRMLYKTGRSGRRNETVVHTKVGWEGGEMGMFYIGGRRGWGAENVLQEWEERVGR
jgi:hypothetical protein